jgi:hypothetical protein
MKISRTIAFTLFFGFASIMVILVFVPGNITEQQAQNAMIVAICFAALGGVFLKWGEAILSGPNPT